MSAVSKAVDAKLHHYASLISSIHFAPCLRSAANERGWVALGRVRGPAVPLSFERLLLVRHERCNRVLQPLDGRLQLCKPSVSVVGQRDQHPDHAQEIFPVDVDGEHGSKTKISMLLIRDPKSRQLRISTLRILRCEGAICQSEGISILRLLPVMHVVWRGGQQS